ncbi:MAG TPA: RDD family protein [Thiobacillaceae bacterium]|nr:RDD family protein [Thiobacillaceae bacterium]HNU64257.1 RDD family protein [Thiobacillaceae bacterium]
MNRSDTPSLGRRLLCVLYDSLLLSGVLLVAAFPFVGLIQGLEPAVSRLVMQAYVVGVAGLYFTLFWRKGQTLAMKTWRFRLETRAGAVPSWSRAWLRYLLACANLASLGMGWWVALLRADGQFLQDHLAGTRLVNSPPRAGGTA